VADQVIKIDSGDIVFDSELSVGQVRRMSVQDGTLDGIIEVLAEIVSSWPLDGSPSDSESWDNLTMTEFNQIVTGITESMGNALKQ